MRTNRGRKMLTEEEFQARYEDYLWMIENGETFERAAARLDLTPDGLKKFLHVYRQKVAC